MPEKLPKKRHPNYYANKYLNRKTSRLKRLNLQIRLRIPRSRFEINHIENPRPFH